MNFKKNWKRFWTLSSAREGFTLVELIVVIAILAILAGVAVPAYSGYVKKANMQADMTLASEVAHALTLYYYSHPDEVTSGFVVLDMEESYASDEAMTAAMDAAFGDGWEQTALLKYDGWSNGELPDVANAEIVANSSYFKNSTPAELITSFGNLTDALSGMAATASQDPLITLGNLPGDFMTAAEIEAMRAQLDTLGVSWDKDKDAYTNAVANLLVNNSANEIGAYDGTQELSGMANLAVQYSLLYGWGTSTEEGKAVLDELNVALTTPGISSGDVLDAVNSAMEKAGADESFINYSAGEAGYNDSMALISIMGTVGDWSADADMTTSGLYSSASISDTVNNYAGAVSSIAGMSAEQKALWDAWDGEGTIVWIDASGNADCPILPD